MEDLDFGPIVDEVEAYIPDECCDDLDFGEITAGDIVEDTINSNPIRRNYTIIAYKEFDSENCQDRRFTVNMHTDGSWSYTYTNGEFLEQEETDFYCNEIRAAQSYLETQENWFNQGKGLGKWNFGQNPGAANGSGAHSGNGTVYFPAGRSNDSFGGSNGSCSVQSPSAF